MTDYETDLGRRIYEKSAKYFDIKSLMGSLAASIRQNQTIERVDVLAVLSDYKNQVELLELIQVYQANFPESHSKGLHELEETLRETTIGIEKTLTDQIVGEKK